MLEEHGYELVIAASGHEGLRLFMSRPVDAIVLEYYLGLLDGATIADEIKQVRPEVPIVMLADHVKLPGNALKSVDALVAKCDGPDLLLATIHRVLQTKQASRHQEACAKQSTPPVGGTTANPSRPRILVVDDDPSVRESVAMLLRSVGYDVVVAEDGFGALSQLGRTPTDVVLSDLGMPGMSGYELLSEVHRRFPRILTLAMSGAYAGDELPPGVIADGFYAKGGHPRSLFRTLEEVIRSAPVRGSAHQRDIAPA